MASTSSAARAALAELAAGYDLVDPGDCDVIVALVAVTRISAHSANLGLSIDGVERMARFMGTA